MISSNYTFIISALFCFDIAAANPKLKYIHEKFRNNKSIAYRVKGAVNKNPLM